LAMLSLHVIAGGGACRCGMLWATIESCAASGETSGSARALRHALSAGRRRRRGKVNLAAASRCPTKTLARSSRSSRPS
jgi:hypothetical protein